MKKLLILTEASFQGSGYFYVMFPILRELSKEYDIKVIGLNYDGREHDYGFTIVPCKSLQDASAMISNLHYLWKFDLFICGLDIPMQIAIKDSLRGLEGLKQIAVTPMENGPLTSTWVAGLMGMEYTFFISELATSEAHKAGLLKSEHLNVSVDTKSFPFPTESERTQIRNGLEIDDKFVILTVADNQERKNLWAALWSVSELKNRNPDINIRYFLVTREHSQVGNKLRDLAISLDINKELVIIERGIPQEDLWKLYVASDVFLLSSKAEGLGIPILEAMSSGVPVVATQTGAITELLSENRGFLIPPEYEFLDVWGNSLRSMIDRNQATHVLEAIYKHEISVSEVITNARKYVESRTVDIPSQQMKKKIEEITNE